MVNRPIEELEQELWTFMHEHVFPAEPVWRQQLEELGPHAHPPIMSALKREARGRGLWNLFLPDASGLTNAQYGRLAEITGWSPVIAPEAINCQAPDSGNMETLHLFGSPEQKRRWLDPLLDGEIRSAFAMTEPEVASSDATNIATTIERDGDEFVVRGHKWWITGVADERCEVFLVLGRSGDDEAPRHRRHSIVLVPRDAPGVEIVRHLPIFGFQDQHGHSEIRFHDVRVPADALLGEVGDGFRIAQARLGPGRVHHAMRAIGMAERALSILIERAKSRVAFGQPLADNPVVQAHIADSRMEIDQVRLYVLETARLIDAGGASAARTAVAGIKVAAPRVANQVIDRAIEVCGALGLSDDIPLSYFSAWARALRVVDGPDAVHRRSIARTELQREIVLPAADRAAIVPGG